MSPEPVWIFWTRKNLLFLLAFKPHIIQPVLQSVYYCLIVRGQCKVRAFTDREVLRSPCFRSHHSFHKFKFKKKSVELFVLGPLAGVPLYVA